ncbi:hypothetical protein PACILC2_39240 [Paenibacillus cisolokensis]|uniref:Uncharacterized protein n=1 Tax=Paenibacillus cisolokensis TaxID=1658519 RepID=A0ABQ4NBV3_9BACL|nr:hypothetical protein PACILC2_39240 [Paenibacillus cisolokensis]
MPAYHQAERRLLYVMMHDASVAQTVHDRVGDGFIAEEHAALAAYIYAYYAQDNEPDVSRFIATLQDDRLQRAASSILMMDGDFPFDEQLLEDYVKEILKVPKLREIERKKKRWCARSVPGM